MQVDIRLLGGFEVDVGGVAIARDAWPRKQAAHLVKLLALAPNRRLHREQVIDSLWPESMLNEAAPRLHQAAHYARSALGSRDAVVFGDEMVALFPNAAVAIDVVRFDELDAIARRTEQIADVEAALAAYGGDLLPDDPYEDWLVEARERRRLRYLELLRLAERWEELIATDPTDEDAHLRAVNRFVERGDRAGALRQFDFMESTLRRTLDVEPGEAAAEVRERVLAMPVEMPALEHPVGRPTRVPRPATSTIGRASEIAGVEALLDRSRVVTLLGPGGVGKTRLACEVAIGRSEADGWDTCFVDLTQVREAGLVPALVVRELGIHHVAASDVLSALDEALRGRRMLLVLDNFEHVLDAAPIVSQITRIDGDTYVLATSRALLRVAGETVFEVEPLGLESQDAPVGDAMRLFGQAATAVDPSFDLEEHVDDVVSICRSIDGLPLAIELAAGHVRTLPPSLLRARLGVRLGSSSASARDAPERQQTIAATIDWSLQLLGPSERQLFARLGMFETGVTLDAIEVVCAEPGVDVVDALGHLVDQSLVKRSGGDGEPRFVMLELLRERARVLLEEERDVMGRRHADYVARVLDDIEERRWNELSGSWIELVNGMLAEIRSAHTWAVDAGDVEVAARLTAGLGAFWHRDGHHVEGRAWVHHALEHVPELTEPLRGRVHVAAGFLEWPRSMPSALTHWDSASDIFRRLGDHRYLSYALALSAGSFIGDVERYDEALRRCEEGIALARQVGERPLIAQGLNVLGELARVHGDDELARVAYEEGRDLAIAAGDAAHLTVFIANLSYLADHRGDYRAARELNCEALMMCRTLGRRMMAAWTLSELAGPETGLGRPERGALFVGAADAALQALGVGRHPGDAPEHDRVVALLREALGEQRSSELQARGARLSLDAAIDLALSEADPLEI